MIRWLLCDYGGVLCHPQPDDDLAALRGRAGVDRAAWDEVFWRHRAAYDEGTLDARAYWEATLDRPVDDAALRLLVDADRRSWLHVDRSAVGAAASSGLRLALLSNAPHEVADAIDRLEELAPFEPRIFSARLGLVKPDPAIYRTAIWALGVTAAEVRFVDDRADNVEAASAAGMQARHFTGDPSVLGED